jgi:hypothetical protein
LAGVARDEAQPVHGLENRYWDPLFELIIFHHFADNKQARHHVQWVLDGARRSWVGPERQIVLRTLEPQPRANGGFGIIGIS